MTTTLSGPAPAAAYAGESLPASTPPEAVEPSKSSRRAGGGRIAVRPRLTQAESVQLALEDYKTAAGAERKIRMLGGEGVILPTDVPRLQRACWKILDLLLDGKPHTWEEIQRVSGTPRSSDRRRRELDGLGCKVVMVVREGPGNFDWQLVNAAQLRADVVACARAMGEAARREAAAKAARA